MSDRISENRFGACLFILIFVFASTPVAANTCIVSVPMDHVPASAIHVSFAPSQSGYVSLVKGHWWEFNGTHAWKSDRDRWWTENMNWVGSEYWKYWGGKHYDFFIANTTHPISVLMRQEYGRENISTPYGAHEENVLYNATGTDIVGYWHLINPSEYVGPVTAYQHHYLNGSVFHAGIMASDIIGYDACMQTFLVGAVKSALINGVGGDESTGKIAVVEPIFTNTAYSSAFYVFYGKYGSSNQEYITTDLNYLNVTVKWGWGWSNGLYAFLSSNKAKQQGLVMGQNLNVIDEIDVTLGGLFHNGKRAYNVLILGFTEYVTKEEYYAYKEFVASGGTLIIMDACNFLAEVRYYASAAGIETYSPQLIIIAVAAGALMAFTYTLVKYDKRTVAKPKTSAKRTRNG